MTIVGPVIKFRLICMIEISFAAPKRAESSDLFGYAFLAESVEAYLAGQ
jgi:hypothetical protein